MHSKLTAATIFLSLFTTGIFGQNTGSVTFPNGAKAALSLTYDDGLPSHVSTAGPALDKYGLKGTFFVTVSAPSVRSEMDKWRQLAKNGHELANHSIYHPCQKSKPGRDWVKNYLNLDGYTQEQLLAEIQVTNTFLQALDGETSRTFAYPCADLHIGAESFKDSIGHYATAARGVHDGLVPPLEIDLLNVPAWAPNGQSGQELIAYVQSVIDQQTFSTICFHGVGAEYLLVSKEAHEELLQWLAGHRHEIWVATFEEVTEFLQSKKEK